VNFYKKEGSRNTAEAEAQKPEVCNRSSPGRGEQARTPALRRHPNPTRQGSHRSLSPCRLSVSAGRRPFVCFVAESACSGDR
jgi:hypothetical protein